MTEAAPTTQAEQEDAVPRLHPAWFVLAKMRINLSAGNGIRLSRDDLAILCASPIGPLLDAARNYGTASDWLAKPDPRLMSGAELISSTERDQLAADLRKAREEMPETLNTGNLVHDVRTLRMAHDSMHRHACRWGKAALLLLPFVDMAAGEGLEWIEQDGSPRMDAADLCFAFAETMGCELGDAAYTAMMTEGEAAIAALNATPDPKDAGGTAKGEDRDNSAH